MKIKTSELSGMALRYAVATSLGRLNQPEYSEPGFNVYAIGRQLFVRAVDGERVLWEPDIDWSQGGPIIDRDQIGLNPPNDGRVIRSMNHAGQKNVPAWEAHISGQHRHWHPSPLIAAMRCYVASMLGDEVAIPEELAHDHTN